MSALTADGCVCRMTVVEGWFGGIKYDRVPAAAELHEAELDLIEVNAAVNSQASSMLQSWAVLA